MTRDRSASRMPRPRQWGGLILYASPVRHGVWQWHGRVPGRPHDVWARNCTEAEIDAHVATVPPLVSVSRAAELYLGGVALDADGRVSARTIRGGVVRGALAAVGLELRGREVYADPEQWEGATGPEVLAYFAGEAPAWVEAPETEMLGCAA